jgi:hypothetical protein
MTPSSQAAKIAATFRLEDVTEDPEMVGTAFDIVVQGYSLLSSVALDPGEVRATVCEDIYHREGRARTLLLTGCRSEASGREPLGTIRITLPYVKQGEETPPLEAMLLMDPAEGWQNFRFEGFNLDQVAEGGRTAILPICRTDAAKNIGLPD